MTKFVLKTFRFNIYDGKIAIRKKKRNVSAQQHPGWIIGREYPASILVIVCQDLVASGRKYA